MPTYATPGDAIAALEDLRDAIRNVLSLDVLAAGPQAMRELTTRFDTDLAEALTRADAVLDGLVQAAEDAALAAEDATEE
jgi:hypothetical protein